MRICHLILLIFFFGNLAAQEVNIPDNMFKYKLLNATSDNQTAKNLLGQWTIVDTNYNGIIEVSEAAYIQELDLDWTACCYYIQNLEGIQAFTNLNVLDVGSNQLTTLDLSMNTNLQSLNCNSNSLTTINLSGLTQLHTLDCSQNQLTTLNLSNLTSLHYLDCGYNQLTSLNLTAAGALDSLECSNNQLTSLDVSDCLLLQGVNCTQNVLTSLDFSNCPNVLNLYCQDNELTSITFAQEHALQDFTAQNNLLTSIDLSGATMSQVLTINLQYNQFVIIDLMGIDDNPGISVDNNPSLQGILAKNGVIDTYLTFSNCPNLVYICIDENDETVINNKIGQYGLTGLVHVNTYCSFVPGGEFYTIQGENRLDLNANGCDPLDMLVPNIKYTITGTETTSLIADDAGYYSMPLQEGIYTITPVLENPDYYTVTPASVQVSLSGANSPFIQNFCFSVSIPKPDLEVEILPITPSRPGFDAAYSVIYRNKGNTMQNSGTVSVTFEDEFMDFLSASPDVFLSGNTLTYNFTDIYPFEAGDFSFSVNINSPTEVPAVNAGMILNFTANITSPATDITPSDNIFSYNEVVVNSFDPNDKTCLEGDIVGPEIAGKFVHYMIRFENTGTFAAENIVVMDMIDTTKFDVASLVPLSGSHSYTTRITENKVEFIFENIDLPFDDDNNDGYLAFKIKTLPTLIVGDTFTNSAAIYFDYNYPIITNDAVTLIQILGNQDFHFMDYFSVYPNPVDTTLLIGNPNKIKLSSASIYNTLGQLLLTISGADGLEAIDVSSLPTGNYFIKLVSSNGTAATQFIKK